MSKRKSNRVNYDRVYWWQGGTESGRWNEVVVNSASRDQTIAGIEGQGYVALPGASTIGPPEGPPVKRLEELNKRLSRKR